MDHSDRDADQIHSLLADVVTVIRADDELKECFNHVLKVGSSTQQVRVATLLKQLEKMHAPAPVLKFVQLLANDQIAHLILKEINKS